MKPQTRARDVVLQHVAQRVIDGDWFVGDPLVDIVTEAIEWAPKAPSLYAALERAGVPEEEMS